MTGPCTLIASTRCFRKTGSLERSNLAQLADGRSELAREAREMPDIDEGLRVRVNHRLRCMNC